MRVVSKGFSRKGTILVKRHTKGFVRQQGNKTYHAYSGLFNVAMGNFFAIH